MPPMPIQLLQADPGEPLILPDGRRVSVLPNSNLLHSAGEVVPDIKDGMVLCAVLETSGRHSGKKTSVAMTTRVKPAVPRPTKANRGRPLNTTNWRGWAAKNSTMLDALLLVPKGLTVGQASNYFRIVKVCDLSTVCSFHRRGLLCFRTLPAWVANALPIHPCPPAGYFMPYNVLLQAVYATGKWDQFADKFKTWLKEVSKIGSNLDL